MRHYLLIALIAVTVSFGFAQISFAVCGGVSPNFFCDDNPPNPDLTGIQEASNDADLTVDILPGAEIDTLNGNGGTGVDTGDGNDVVTVTDATITADNDAIELRGGNNTVTIIRSNLFPDSGDGIDTIAGNDVINVTDSRIITRVSNAIILGGGDDDVTITRSIITRLSGTDTIFLSAGNDTVTYNTEAEVNGRTDCGSGFDTLIFAMEVPEERLNFISNQLALATVPDGSITIDGLFYEWIECELLVNELVGVRVTRPIPTLSQWGLIAMAGIIGLAGFIAIRKKYAAA